ncbi:MAG: dipeptidase [Planctomycetaceae bacterium TMED240]|nr:dipeptidase [Rhodopirellula sp.]OUX06484.1 MAG: dipeptidase [Planctomycetaceae bacterium TMED240]
MQSNDSLNRRSFLGTTGALATCAVNQAVQQPLGAQEPPVKLSDKASESAGSKASIAAITERLNPKITSLRQATLRILQPTPSELEKGLRLHAESVVFDSYGFSPRAAVDGAALAKLVESGASSIELDDVREDMMMTRVATDPVQQQEYRDAWRASGVTCIFQNAGEEGQDPLRLLKRLARFTYVTDLMRGFVSKAASPQDVLNAKQEGRHCLYMTGNGVPLTQQWVSVPDELRYVRIFYQLGIRMMHLTYQRRNMIGDGCGEKTDAGLSDFGEAAIAEMNRVGVIPDCAHSGWQTSLEAARVSTKPVVASHSVCGGIYPHIRSKPDEVIRAIADSGGYIGICCIPRFLRGDGDVSALLDHVDYVIRKFGPDHVAIGTDVAYQSQDAGRERAKVPGRGKRRTEFRSLWPKDDYQTSQQANDSLAWTNWPLFTVGLVQRGHDDDVIRKVIGGNVMRVARSTLV